MIVIRSLRTVGSVLAALALTAAGLAVASPAQAASWRAFPSKINGKCMWADGVANGNSGIVHKSCAISPNTAAKWTYTQVGTLNGHALWTLKNNAYGNCLSTWTTTSTLNARRCDSADAYQKWEVFYTGSGDNRTITLKSYGGWTVEGKHRCIYYNPDFGSQGLTNVQMSCNVNDKHYQWKA
jgi:hypothetical protein